MDAISSPPPHSISLGGLRTPAPVCAAPPSWGRHPKTFTTTHQCVNRGIGPELLAHLAQVEHMIGIGSGHFDRQRLPYELWP